MSKERELTSSFERYLITTFLLERFHLHGDMAEFIEMHEQGLIATFNLYVGA